MNYRLIGFALGELALILGALMCIPMFMAVGYGENTDNIFAFLITICVCIVLGVGGILIRPPKDKRNLRPSSGFAICGLFWIFIGLVSALPFCISKSIPNFVDALFETISGFTTTGASVLTNVEAMPKSMLFWRSFIQLIGGMGVLVFVIALIPSNDKMSTALAKAEIPGPQFGKLVSKLRFTTRILYAIYIVMTFILVGVLCACDMPVFDSFCHAFSTASTGGFSVKNASIAAYNSVSIDIVITIFMMLFSVNFNIYFFIIVGQFVKAFKNEEFWCMFAIYIVVTFAVTINLSVANVYNFADALRYASFNVASTMSTTGYATADFGAWPALSQVLMIGVMCIGGSAGSTAGGMKVSRVILLGKSSFLGLRKTLSPRSVYSVKMDGKAVDDATMVNIKTFLALYVIIIALSTIFVSTQTPSLDGTGYSAFETNFSAVIACFNNIGPGIGAVGPTGNYAGYGIFSKLVLVIDMLLGRLEILPMLLIFLPKSWKKI